MGQLLVSLSTATIFSELLTTCVHTQMSLVSRFTVTNRKVPQIGHAVGCHNVYTYMQKRLLALSLIICLPLTAGSDFMAGPYTASFLAGQLNATLMVSTVNDNITELSEYFMVVITSVDQSNVDIVSPNTTLIAIQDNDPGNIQLCNISSVGVMKLFSVFFTDAVCAY